MPKEYDDCIKGYLAKGLSKEEAQKRCSKLRQGQTEHSAPVEEVELGLQNFPVLLSKVDGNLEEAFDAMLSEVEGRTDKVKNAPPAPPVE